MMQKSHILGGRTSDAPSVLLVVFIIAWIVVILAFSNGRPPSPPMDQGFVLIDLSIHRSADHNWVFQYPHLEWAGGITASLLIGIYKLLIKTDISTLNFHVKILSSIMFLSSVVFLIKSALKSVSYQIIAIILCGTSGLLYLEPSSEAIAASFLCLFLALQWRGYSPILQGLALALFSLTKAELLYIGVFIAFAWILVNGIKHANTYKFSAAYILCIIALLSPSWYLYGVGASRAFMALEAGICGTAAVLDICQGSKFIPSIKSVSDVIFHHWDLYSSFLLRSSVEIAYMTIQVLGILTLVIPVVVYLGARKPIGDTRTRLFFLVTIVTLLGTISFAMLVGLSAPRYMTRVYPLIVVAFFLCYENIIDGRLYKRRNLVATTLIMLMTVAPVQNIYFLPRYILHPHSF